MRILDRYIGREVLTYALLGLALFTFVFFVPQLVRLMELVVRNSADLGTLGLLILCTLPGVLTFTVPMAVLVGVLIGLGRMSADSEVIAMHATGIGLRRMLLPVSGLALAAGLLTLLMTFHVAPVATRMFHAIEDELRTAPAAVLVQPRVFDERFGRLVLYVQDADAAAVRWRGILLADAGTENESRVTLAEEAILVADRRQGKLQLNLKNGSTHSYAADQADRYGLSTFAENDLAVEVTGRVPVRPRRPSMAERSTTELLSLAAQGTREARIEYHRRLAFPAACLLFALLGVPVGVRPGRGGRAAGFVVTLLLVCGYYLLFVSGIGLARRDLLPAGWGVWAANLLTLVGALAMLPGMEQIRGEGPLSRFREWLAAVRRKRLALAPTAANGPAAGNAARRPFVPFSSLALRGVRGGGFPLLMDLLVLRQFLSYFLLLMAGFLLLFESFTFFELLEDIGRNRVPFTVVVEYFAYLTPHMFYQLAPLTATVAGLVVLAVMSKNNEVTAFKATGISLYRLSLPLLAAGGVLALALFLLDDTVLPYANRIQDALRNQIKGRPAQTFHQPRRQWIFGEQSRLYNYDLFDPDRSLFGGLNVFELDPATFQMKRRVHARRAHWHEDLNTWVLEEGWVRDFEGPRVASYVPFKVITLAELTEPPTYFRREVRQSYQMDSSELSNYIGDLRQAGFDVARLTVQWHRKFAFPLMSVVLVLLAIPFALQVGPRGASGGLAAGVGIAIVFWSASALFEAMGAVGQLPPLLAGWSPALIFSFLGLYFYFKTPT